MSDETREHTLLLVLVGYGMGALTMVATVLGVPRGIESSFSVFMLLFGVLATIGLVLILVQAKQAIQNR